MASGTMPSPDSRGFTLPELLVALAIAGLAAALAVPALGDAIARHRLRAAADDLLETLLKARSISVWRDQPTRVCPSSDGRTCAPSADWTLGWIAKDAKQDVFASAAGLDARLGTARRASREKIDFAHNGTSPGTNQTIVLCVKGRPATALAVIVNNAGLPHREPAKPGDAALCANAPSRRR